ncbi:hypothetical protein [Halpernia sp. GG3]
MKLFSTEKEDSKIQDILYCIKDCEKLTTEVGNGFGKRRGLKSDNYYIKDSEDLKKDFQDFPDAFEAYSELLEKFTPYTLKRDVLLPKFEIPEQFLDKEDLADAGKRGEMAYLTHLTYEGAKNRYGEITEKIRKNRF